MALAVTARGQEVGTLTARILSKWALNGHIFSHCKCNCSDLHFVTRDLPPHRCCGNTAQPQLGCRSMDATALPAAPPRPAAPPGAPQCSSHGATCWRRPVFLLWTLLRSVRRGLHSWLKTGFVKNSCRAVPGFEGRFLVFSMDPSRVCLRKTVWYLFHFKKAQLQKRHFLCARSPRSVSCRLWEGSVPCRGWGWACCRVAASPHLAMTLWLCMNLFSNVIFHRTLSCWTARIKNSVNLSFVEMNWTAGYHWFHPFTLYSS